MDAKVFLIREAGQYCVGNGADAQLEGRTIGNQPSDVRTDVLLDIAKGSTGVFG